MYIVEDTGNDNCNTRVMRSQYYAVSIEVLMNIMQKAGFTDVSRIDDIFYQPIIIGKKL